VELLKTEQIYAPIYAHWEMFLKVRFNKSSPPSSVDKERGCTHDHLNMRIDCCCKTLCKDVHSFGHVKTRQELALLKDH
jgi:hypothetical protein